jgi:tetratricopeptide (TPR) repeat protein
MTGAYDQAAEAYRVLAQDEANRVEAVLGLTGCRLQQGKYTEAIEALTSLNAKENPEWHVLLASALDSVGRYTEAIEHAREALRLKADDANARWLLGRLLETVGRREEAIEVYHWFETQLLERGDLPRDAAWLTAAAQGFVRYSVLTQSIVADRLKHALREMVQVAYTRVDRKYWPARIVAADWLRERFNNDEDDGSVSDYQAALRINPHLPQAHVGLGEVALTGWQFEEVERQAERALAINPNYSPAFHLLAKKLIVERRYAQAMETCDKALTVNPDDGVALSLRAAAAACRGDQAEVAVMRSRVEGVNPKPAVFHRVLADALSGIRQFEAAEREYQKAIEYDPMDANARTELGLMYMQWGPEDRAREALTAAWSLDPFNDRTKHTLDLLDALQRFDRVETPHFIVRFDAEKDPGLGPFVADYLEQIYPAVTRDYEAHLAEKTIIEIFPSQRTFAVRITGKPWIHTVGACTGRVIALASPRSGDDRMGPYNIARVLKHEFTHTVTLAATENRIPHWFTEGLAVFQEDSPRSFEWCELLAEAVRLDELYTLQSIDWGFMRPKRPQDRTLAYAQSEWMCEFLAERFGYDTLNAMIAQYREGKTQDQVLVELLKIPRDTFDREFAAWARRAVEEWGFDLTPPEDLEALRVLAEKEGVEPGVLGRLARAELDHDEVERAFEAAKKAIELDSNERNGLTVFVRIRAEEAARQPTDYQRRLMEDELLPMLERLRKADPAGWTAPKVQAEIRLRREEWDDAIEPLMTLQRLCPMDPASWRGLAGVYLEKDDLEKALPQLMELARTEEHDAQVPARIASILRRKGQWPEAQYWLRQALYIDPFNTAFLDDLAATCLQVGDTKSALKVYTMLTQLEPLNPRRFEAAAFAAHKLGEVETAHSLAAKALQLDPQSPAGVILQGNKSEGQTNP